MRFTPSRRENDAAPYESPSYLNAGEPRFPSSRDSVDPEINACC